MSKEFGYKRQMEGSEDHIIYRLRRVKQTAGPSMILGLPYLKMLTLRGRTVCR